MGHLFSKQDSNEEITKQINDLDFLISDIAAKQESIYKEINSQNDDIKKLVYGKESVKIWLNTSRHSPRGDQSDYMYKANVLQRQLDDLNRRCDELLKERDHVDAERKRFEREKEHLEREVKRLKQDKDNEKAKFERQNKELEREVQRLKEDNDYEKLRIKQQNKELEKELQRVKHRLDEATRRKPVQVYIYAPSMNEKISTAVRSELQVILTQHLEATRGRQLEIVYTFEARSVPINKPLIVLCINASRLGTDVEQALQQVNCSKSVTVAVIHHKEIHALPPQTSEKLLYGDKFRDLYCIVDIAFLTSKGMYTCDMNNKALERLTDFICQFDT